MLLFANHRCIAVIWNKKPKIGKKYNLVYMTKRQLQEQWIIQQCKATQELGGTVPELDLRYELAQKFNIRLDWAYQLIRELCKNHPNLHLQKIEVEGYGGTKWNEYEVTWKD